MSTLIEVGMKPMKFGGKACGCSFPFKNCITSNNKSKGKGKLGKYYWYLYNSTCLLMFHQKKKKKNIFMIFYANH